MGSTTSSTGSSAPVSSQAIIKALTPNGQGSPTQNRDASTATSRLQAAQKLDKAIDSGQLGYTCTGKNNELKLNMDSMKGLNGDQKKELTSAFNTLAEGGQPLRDKERCPQ